MSQDTPKSPKRRIVVRLTARERSDPLALLEMIRATLAEKNLILVCRHDAPPEEPEATQTTDHVRPDEVLETKARELAQSVLDAAAAKAEKEQVSHERDAERMRQEIAAQRVGTKAYIGYLLTQGVRIGVELWERTAEALGAVAGLFAKQKDK